MSLRKPIAHNTLSAAGSTTHREYLLNFGLSGDRDHRPEYLMKF
jgi:hypothetical protein